MDVSSKVFDAKIELLSGIIRTLENIKKEGHYLKSEDALKYAQALEIIGEECEECYCEDNDDE